MRTHLDIGLITARQQACSRLAAICVFLAVQCASSPCISFLSCLCLDRETKIDLKKYSVKSRTFSEPLAESGLSRRFDQTSSSQGKMVRNIHG